MTSAQPPSFEKASLHQPTIWGRRRRRITVENDDELAAIGDAELLVAISRRQEAGFNEVLRRHEAVLLRSARRLLLDASLAEEVVQEVFVRLWNQPEKFDAARGSLRAYLLAQAHSRGVDLIRSESARRNRERRARDSATGTAPTEPADDAAAVVTSLAVRDAVAALPADEREAIEMAYFGGCSYVEAAKRLSLPEGTVKSRIRVGLLRLRDDLDARGVRV